MTTTVVEKTAITLEKSRRRHQDSSWLWITVFTGSVVLHLLAFLLVRSSDEFKPWFVETAPETITVDLIDLDSQSQTIAKTLSPKSQTSQPTTKNQDDGKINSDLSLVETRKNDPVVTTSPTPTPSTKPTAKQQAVAQSTTPPPRTIKQQTVAQSTTPPTTTAQTPVGELPWQRNRQNLQLGQGKLLTGELPENLRNTTTDKSPAANPTSTPEANQDNLPQNQSTPDQVNQNNRLSNQDDSRQTQSNADSFSGNTTSNPQNQPLDHNSEPPATVGLIARWRFLSPQEQRIKMQKYPPDKDLILPQYTGSKEPEINITDHSSQDLPSGKFLVSLVINRNGNLENAEFFGTGLSPDDQQKVVSLTKDIFQGESFVPHRFPDQKTPPELSNLLVWITIQPTKS